MIFEEGGKFSADSRMEMDPITGLEIINDKIDAISSKASYLEDTSFLEVKDNSCQASCLDKGVGCEFKDVLPDLSLFDSPIHFQNDGFTETSSSSSDQTEDEELFLETQTPTKSIFDPFAPSTDYLIVAPKKKKLRKSYVPLRRLDFDAGSESKENVEGDPVKNFDEDEQFLESVFNSLFEMIISAQLKEISAATMVTYSDIFKDCKTPLSLPLLSGIAKTCPPAPMRPTLTLERQSHNLCRKLDFGNNMS